MKNVYMAYKTDSWHSYASRDIIGVGSTHDDAIAICQAQAKKERSSISGQEMFNLENINQTQGYKGEGEFVIEEIQLNTLL